MTTRKVRRVEIDRSGEPASLLAAMSTIEAIVLGIVQGLTEFLPISSSGHLRIVPALLGWDDPGPAFTAVIQLGTMAAVLLYFRADLWRIAVAWVRELRDADRAGAATTPGSAGTSSSARSRSRSSASLQGPDRAGARNLYLIGTALIVFSF